MTTSEKIKVAIVGFGKSAVYFHIPLIKALNDFCITSIVSSRRDDVIQLLPDVEVYSNLEELLLKSKIDLVIITTPNHLHYEHAKLALLSKKHVVVEKPFVLKYAHGEELIKLAKENQVKLSVYHNRRWDSGFLTLRKLICEGVLGEINYYEARYDRFRPNVINRWKEEKIDGAGILWDLAPHLIDQALLLFGKPKDIVSDLAIQRKVGKVIDYFYILFKYEKLRVVLCSSSLAQYKRPHILAQSEHATYVRFDLDPQEESLMKGKNPDSHDWGQDKEESTFLYKHENGTLVKLPVKVDQGSYESFYKQLAKSIKENSKVPVCPEEALEVVKVIEKINSSQMCDFIV